MTATPRVHGLALVTSVATLVLIVAGGLVTNTGSALAVPDWPTTFGHNPFLFPWSGMVGGVFFEHGHRLLGAAVGLLTVALAAAVWATDRRAALRGLAALAVGLVAVQGLLGGLRVVLLRDALGLVHGCVAQAFFGLLVTLAVLTRPAGAPRPVAAPGRLKWLAPGAVLLLYGQVVLGALTTHAGWVNLHLGGAAVVTAGLLALAGHTLRRPPTEVWLRRGGGTIAILLGVQVALGLGAYVARFTGIWLPGGQGAAVALPVAHRAVGALLLGAAVALALHAVRAGDPGRLGASAPVGTGLAGSRVAA